MRDSDFGEWGTLGWIIDIPEPNSEFIAQPSDANRPLKRLSDGDLILHGSHPKPRKL